MHVSKDPKFWDGIGEKFYGKYFGIDNCHKEWADMVVQGLPLVGPLGREWSIPMKRNKRTGDLEIPWTVLTNYPVQGTGADIMMLARISFARRLKILPLNGTVIMISTVHDSVVVDASDVSDVQTVVNLFHQVFDDIPKNIKKLFGYTWNVPMDCECKVGPNMLAMEKVKRTDKN